MQTLRTLRLSESINEKMHLLVVSLSSALESKKQFPKNKSVLSHELLQLTDAIVKTGFLKFLQCCFSIKPKQDTSELLKSTVNKRYFGFYNVSSACTIIFVPRIVAEFISSRWPALDCYYVLQKNE